jgi:maltose alpha-D-glucosyltransferase/alpha-amylase
MVTDFEGEPARARDEAGRKSSPLRDVAAMLRSLSYARRSVMAGDALGPWENEARAAFVDEYATAMRGSGLFESIEDAAGLLRLFELERALYELRYELDNRPEWSEVPLSGILAMLENAQ